MWTFVSEVIANRAASFLLDAAVRSLLVLALAGLGRHCTAPRLRGRTPLGVATCVRRIVAAARHVSDAANLARPCRAWPSPLITPPPHQYRLLSKSCLRPWPPSRTHWLLPPSPVAVTPGRLAHRADTRSISAAQ